MKVKLSKTSARGQVDDVVDVAHNVAEQLVLRGMATAIPGPTKETQPARGMTMLPEVDVDTLKKRGTDEAVIIQP